MGTIHFAAIDGDWADDPHALAAALRAAWPAMTVTPSPGDAHRAYELALGDDLGSLHADGRGISFKHGEELVIRLAAWWRERIPPAVKLAVLNDSTATPVYVTPGMTADELRERVAAAER